MVLAVGFLLMGVVIVVVAVALIAAPIVRWWYRRKGVTSAQFSAEFPSESPSPRASAEPPPDDLDGPIVDAEFHVKDG